MKIFNLQIFASDAEAFNELSSVDKLNWIKANTNQQNDEIIYEFLKNSNYQSETNCLNCGELDNKIVRYGSNISKKNAIENADSIERELVKRANAVDNIKRPGKAKRKKD